jgi:hypothetical protein
MSLLRDAIRHSATGAVNAQGIANTRSSRAFRSIAIRSSRRPEPRVHLAGPRYPLPPGRANADFKAIIRGEWHVLPVSRCGLVAVIMGSFTAAQIMAFRLDAIAKNTGPLMRRGHAPRGSSRRQDPSRLRCHLSHQHPRPYARFGGCNVRGGAGVSPGSVSPVQPKAARPSRPRHASNGLPVSIVLARNESRTNRARIADSSLVGFVHGNIS